MNRIEKEIWLQRAWLSQLYGAHEHICWEYKVPLPRPNLEISNSRTEWGTWNADFRSLKLSVHLIREQPWDIVLHVFKHEVAHQIVTDIFHSADGHGELFRKACEMIGVPDEFRGARGDLRRPIADFRKQAIESDGCRMLEKVRKLLSLAQSENENEAFLAMRKANELIEKYNIDRVEQDRASGCVYAIINHKKKRVENYQRRICSILKGHFFVDVVYADLFDAGDCQVYKTIELLGTGENVAIAEYVYYFLMNQMEILWKVHLHTNGNGVSRNKRSYRLGLLRGLHDKLDREARERKLHFGGGTPDAKSLSALVCSQDRNLEAFTKMRFPRLVSYSSRRATVDMDTFQAGINDGKRLKIYKGIEGKDGYGGRLLEKPQG